MLRLNAKEFNIEKIAMSGQCFRLKKTDEKKYRIIAKEKLVFADFDEAKKEYILHCSAKEEDFWLNYFDADTDYKKFVKAIDKNDRFLTDAAKFSEGMRILRQDKFEMLISFIISQRKNIPAISSSVERISALCGKEIEDGIFAFPTAEEISKLSEEALNGCSLGYRTEYVKGAAVLVAENLLDLKLLDNRSDEDLLKALMEIKGVGIKVANCVSLFGYHRIGAFPIDVWIQRIIDEIYKGNFDKERYKGFAGVIQQYMFFYGRENL